MSRTIQLAVAAAELALGHGAVDKTKLDPTRFGIEFGAGLIATELPDLLAIALGARPEMGATGAAVARSRTRLREEQARPLLPTLGLGFSGGAFGAGSNLVFSTATGMFGGSDPLGGLRSVSLDSPSSSPEDGACPLLSLRKPKVTLSAVQDLGRRSLTSKKVGAAVALRVWRSPL